MQFNVGDIVEHMVYGCGMVEELYTMNGTDYATIWVFDDKECPRENDQRAEVSLRYLKPFVAYVET
jgi:hypothetical protein